MLILDTHALVGLTEGNERLGARICSADQVIIGWIPSSSLVDGEISAFSRHLHQSDGFGPTHRFH
jgi:hypothetical protein